MFQKLPLSTCFLVSVVVIFSCTDKTPQPVNITDFPFQKIDSVNTKIDLSSIVIENKINIDSIQINVPTPSVNFDYNLNLAPIFPGLEVPNIDFHDFQLKFPSDTIAEDQGMTTIYTNGNSYTKYRNIPDFQPNPNGYPDVAKKLMPLNLPLWVYSYNVGPDGIPQMASKQRYRLYNPDGKLVFTYYDEIGNQTQESTGVPKLSRGNNHPPSLSQFKAKPGKYTIVLDVLPSSTSLGLLYFWEQSPTLGTKMLVADEPGSWGEYIHKSNFIKVYPGQSVKRTFELGVHSEFNRFVKSSANIELFYEKN